MIKHFANPFYEGKQQKGFLRFLALRGHFTCVDVVV